MEGKTLLFGSINTEKTNLLRLIEGGTADGDFGLSDVTMNEIGENLTVSSMDDFVERFLPDRCMGLFWQLAKMMDDRRQERYGMTDAAELYGTMLPENRGQKQECVKIRNRLMKHAGLDENVLRFRYLQQMADTESGARMMTGQLLGDICNGLQGMSGCGKDRSRRADIPGELPEGEELTAVYVNLEEYADAVLYDYIPLWNIEVTREKSSAYPQLAIDQIQYGHGIYSTRLKPEREYLVAHEDISVWKTERTPDGLAITCDSPDPVLWNLVAFCKSGKQDAEKDLYSNAGARKLRERCPRTEGEVRRFVSGLGYGDRLILTDVVLVEGSYAGSGRTYSMDSFIEDALCHTAPEQKLLFRFRPRDGSDYLNYDILSYLLSRIQWELPQFLCIGEVV